MQTIAKIDQLIDFVEDQPVVVVCGATGQQGGGVVRALLADGSVRVRGITRNTESDKAKALTAQGVEMVSATFDDPEALRAAFAGFVSGRKRFLF